MEATGIERNVALQPLTINQAIERWYCNSIIANRSKDEDSPRGHFCEILSAGIAA